MAGVRGGAPGWRPRGAAAPLPARRGGETARRIAPLARGEVAAINVADDARRVPALSFKDGAGADKTLADWRGRVILLNLWATWCIPCRKEMPALAALQEKLGGPGFEGGAAPRGGRGGGGRVWGRGRQPPPGAPPQSRKQGGRRPASPASPITRIR